MSMKKCIYLFFFLGAVSTVILFNTSNSFFTGVPIYIYSLLPLGFMFAIILLYSYITFFIFLIYWVRKFRMKYFYQFLIVVLFFLLNIIAEQYTWVNVDFSVLFAPVK